MSSLALKGLPRSVLRLHRAALIVWAAFILAAVGYLVWLTEITADSVRERISACAHTEGFCRAALASTDYSGPMGWISTVAYYSFWAVAAWAGAALIGRELESGTARLAWTQNVSPTRWLAAKLALPALVLVLGGTLFVVVFRWAWSANRDLMGDDWTFNDVFAARGPALVAYGLCALAIGTLTALLLRRALPALAISVTVMIVLNRYLESHRPGLWPAATRTSATGFPTSNGPWPTDDGTYHPASHFWPMNLVETGILLTITALATTAAFVVLRRRTV
ncbi:hypothetical protein [Streptomyces sp. NBC_00005]|uniref:hypothetical protein n=1 Tax=Streptomyces sp. NBC_00005 TaxID=2903609 RepID=UPI0032527014